MFCISRVVSAVVRLSDDVSRHRIKAQKTAKGIPVLVWSPPVAAKCKWQPAHLHAGSSVRARTGPRRTFRLVVVCLVAVTTAANSVEFTHTHEIRANRIMLYLQTTTTTILSFARINYYYYFLYTIIKIHIIIIIHGPTVAVVVGGGGGGSAQPPEADCGNRSRSDCGRGVVQGRLVNTPDDRVYLYIYIIITICIYLGIYYHIITRFTRVYTTRVSTSPTYRACGIYGAYHGII